MPWVLKKKLFPFPRCSNFCIPLPLFFPMTSTAEFIGEAD